VTIHPSFVIEPWALRECRLDLDVLPQTESLFALSNGHIGMRGNLDEGEPHGIPGTYLNSVYELRPLPYAEAGYGYPESGQTLINVTNGKIVRLLVDDEPFDVRYGMLESHERLLDFREGRLMRDVRWRSPSGSAVRIRSERLVSLTQRSIVAIRYSVEALERPQRVVLQSELVANEVLPPQSDDPRAAAALEAPLENEEHIKDDLMALLVHRTRRSGLLLAAAMDHEIHGPDDTLVEVDSFPDVTRATVATRLDVGQRIEIVKYVAYGWSSRRSRPAVHDQVVAALAGARLTGWDTLCEEQRDYLSDYWDAADIEIDGDTELQQAARLASFHVLQASARAEQRPIAAKGLSGPGYDGHTFWDSETYVLAALNYTKPAAVADALRWRHMTLDTARARAETLNLEGAVFPWRTIRGQECSAYWPAGTAAFHVNADIAHAVTQYLDATEDEQFAHDVALEILVATARLWRSLGHHDPEGRFRIDGVTGPDEYTAVVDNNVFTNLMAQRNLIAAADLAVRDRDGADTLGVSIEEVASWRDAARDMHVPYDERLGVHPQSEGFTDHARWDFAHTPPEHYPLLLHYPYFDLYRKQVVKQADLVLAMYLCPDAFTDEEKARNFAYYEAITVRDSSLSATAQCVIAAEVGHLQLAYDYLCETAYTDLGNLKGEGDRGLHLAALAGTRTALVAGFGGLRVADGRLRFSPRIPPEMGRLRFSMRYRARLLQVTVTSHDASYRLVAGEPLTIEHHGEEHELDRTGFSAPIPSLPQRPAPHQPPGRAPSPHRSYHPHA
jgi:alpha,alpha-trehalose phosphorylase